MSVQASNISIVLNSGKKSLRLSTSFTKSSQSVGAAKPSRSFSFAAWAAQGKKIKAEEIYSFANQLSMLLEAGVPLINSLAILSQQTENASFKRVIERVTDDINKGSNFTQAFAQHPKTFPTLFVAMMRAAEKGGEMVAVLKQLSVYMEQQHKLNEKIKAATVYPKFVFFFFTFVLMGIVFGLVPKFQDIFADFGAELPMPTQILMDISEFAKDNLLFEALAIGALVILFKKFKKTRQGELVLDKIKLMLPVVGDLVSKTALSRFSRTLSILIRSGVSLVDALDISSATTQNVHFVNALRNIKSGVISGESLSKMLSQHAVFPIMVVSMISTGEQSGSLDKMLSSISNLYDTHVDSKISGLSSIIEPVLMVGLGILALVVIIALYLPIFFMGEVIN